MADPLDATRQARLDALLDRQDIVDCLTRFCRGIDRFDRALFLSAFHDDAVIDAGPYVGGPGPLYEWARGLHESGQVATLHHLLNMTCDIAGDTAHVETHYLFVGHNRDETNWIAGGRYVDRMERRDGAWRIALRCNAQEWSGTIPGSATPFAGIPDVNLNGKASRGPDDISYRRPLTNRRMCQSPPGVG